MSDKNFNDNLEKLRNVFVSLEIFNLRLAPIEKIVYTGVGLVLISVLSAVIYTVVKR